MVDREPNVSRQASRQRATPATSRAMTRVIEPLDPEPVIGAPCAVNLGVPSWPDWGERRGYSGSGTGVNICSALQLPAADGQPARIPPMHRPVNKQVHLTEIRRADEPAFLALLNDPDMSRFTCRLPYPYTREAFEKWIGIVTAAAAEYGEPIHWAIRNAAGELIGGIGFDNLIKGHRAEIGYWLAKPYWGRGIMSSVVAKACQVAGREWNLVRITALVFENNLASVRVLEKCGFEREARLRKYFSRDGEFSDAFLYARVS
ncbi:MAG: GNAT family N-acetyltransferase [Pirellulaceae bacterium]|nr:GNAT family N-acetyltransferase [Pirellulaceae bacterium]